jgi:hypothetical protein
MTDWIKMAAVFVKQDESLDPLTAARRVNRCGQVQTFLQKKALVSEVLVLVFSKFVL